MSIAAKKSRKMDRKEVAYNQPYEVNDICRTYKKNGLALKKSDLLLLIEKLPKKHSKKELHACLVGADYVYVPRKKVVM